MAVQLNLRIHFPENWWTARLVVLKAIPCVCRVGREFEIVFREPLPIEAQGTVEGWDPDEINKRAPAGVGGTYTQNSCAHITLHATGTDLYQITDLSMFVEGLGWCPIVESGEYAPPGEFWVRAMSRDLENELEAARRASRPRRRRDENTTTPAGRATCDASGLGCARQGSILTNTPGTGQRLRDFDIELREFDPDRSAPE